MHRSNHGIYRLSFHRQFASTCVVAAISLVGLVGCSTPSAIPESYELPTLLNLQLPLAQQSILRYAKDHDGRLPESSLGEQIAVRAIKQRKRTTEELDSTGGKITIDEYIDGGAYVFRPAKDAFILAAAGHIVRTPSGGRTPVWTWFAFQGRYSNSGEVIEDQTSYLENADLFVDAMRSTTNQVSWNASAWAIGRIYKAAVDASSAAAADVMVDRLIKDAIATDLARVPTGMSPREAAFGGTKDKAISNLAPATK